MHRWTLFIGAIMLALVLWTGGFFTLLLGYVIYVKRFFRQSS